MVSWVKKGKNEKSQVPATLFGELIFWVNFHEVHIESRNFATLYGEVMFWQFFPSPYGKSQVCDSIW